MFIGCLHCNQVGYNALIVVGGLLGSEHAGIGSANGRGQTLHCQSFALPFPRPADYCGAVEYMSNLLIAC